MKKKIKKIKSLSIITTYPPVWIKSQNNTYFLNGNVGIGTTSPGYKLDVYNGVIREGLTANLNGTNDGIIMDATGAYAAGGRHSLTWTQSGGATVLGRIALEWSSPYMSYVFRDMYDNGVGSSEIMRIQGNGNVGIGTTSPGTLLTVAGPVSLNAPSTKTAAYSLVATDSSLIFNGSASITLTLQAASSYSGRILYVKTIAAYTVVSASSNVVPLDSATAGTAILAATAGKWAMLQSDGTNWVIMAAN